DIEYYLWVGAFTPKGTPANVISYLRGTFDKAAHADQFKAALANLGQELAYMDQPEFAKFWDADAGRIEAAIRAIGKVQGYSCAPTTSPAAFSSPSASSCWRRAAICRSGRCRSPAPA